MSMEMCDPTLYLYLESTEEHLTGQQIYFRLWKAVLMGTVNGRGEKNHILFVYTNIS